MPCDIPYVLALADNAPLEYAVTLGDGRSRLVYDDELRMLPGWGVADGRYVVIVDADGNRCGGVVRCASSPDDVRLSRATEHADVLVAMRPEFAGRGILSSFLRSGLIATRTSARSVARESRTSSGLLAHLTTPPQRFPSASTITT